MVNTMISFAMGHLEHAKLEVRSATPDRIIEIYFPRDGWDQTYLWQTKEDVMRVTLWGKEHLKKNVIIAMVREKLGLGPKTYWIVNSRSPDFVTALLSQQCASVEEVLPSNLWYKDS